MVEELAAQGPGAGGGASRGVQQAADSSISLLQNAVSETE